MTFVEKQFKTAICEYYNTLYSKTTQLELKKTIKCILMATLKINNLY